MTYNNEDGPIYSMLNGKPFPNSITVSGIITLDVAKVYLGYNL